MHIFHGKYKSFTIYEPKERLIKALPYPDRVVHQWYVEEFIKPYIVPRFINTTYACLKGRGMHSASKQVQKYMREAKRKYSNYWILKCDIRKFFYNIDKDILYRILQKYIGDEALLTFTKKIIFDTNEKIGIPIGNYTSQYFANIYLNELDQYVKRVLKLKYYVRYMDDFVFILPSKKDCSCVKNIIQSYLENTLHLKLNDKTRYYPYKMGVNFCGYRIYETHMLLRNSSKTKIKNNIKKWNKLYEKNELDFNKMSLQFNSWLGHAKHCNSYNLINYLINKGKFFYKN